MPNSREITQAGVDLVKSLEGIMDGDPSTVNLDAYLDPVGIGTIGWGHAIFIGNQPLRDRETRGVAKSLSPRGLSEDECEMLLRADPHGACREVVQLATVPLTENQFAALSFAFNAGTGSVARSTLLCP
jgi:lysozyme